MRYILSRIRVTPQCLLKSKLASFVSPLRAFKETSPFILQHVGCLGPFFFSTLCSTSFSTITILWSSCFRVYSVQSVPELKFVSKTQYKRERKLNYEKRNLPLICLSIRNLPHCWVPNLERPSATKKNTNYIYITSHKLK